MFLFTRPRKVRAPRAGSAASQKQGSACANWLPSLRSVGTAGVSAKGYLLHKRALHCVCGLLVSSLRLGAARLQRQCTDSAHLSRPNVHREALHTPGRSHTESALGLIARAARQRCALHPSCRGSRQSTCCSWRRTPRRPAGLPYMAPRPLMFVPDHAGDHTMGICHDARLTGNALALRTCAMSFLHACWLCHLSCCGAKVDWRACPPAHRMFSRAVQAHHPVH